MANNNDVPIFIRLLGDTKDLQAKLGTAQKDIKSWTSGVESAGMKAGASFGIFGAALEAMAGKAISAASGLEDMKVRLQSITRDGAQATAILNQASAATANTGFTGSQMKEGAIALTVFRQNVQQTLPKVADFAAALGKDVPESAQLIGRAMEGNAKAFKALSVQADISANDLKGFGAVLDSNGKVLTDTQAHIEAARGALNQLLSARYSGAAAAQSQTLSGSITRLEGAMKASSAAFGTALIPAATAGVQSMTALVKAISGVPEWMKVLAGVAAIGGGAISLLGAAALVAVSQFAGLAANMAVLAPQIAIVKASVAGAASTISGALTPAVAALGTSLGFLAGAMGIFTVLLVAGKIAIAQYEEEIKALDLAVTNQAKSLASASGTARSFAGIINKAAGGQFVTLGKDVGETEAQVKKAFSTVPPEQMVAALEKAGLTLDGLRKKFEENRAGAETTRNSVTALEQAIASQNLVGQTAGRVAIPAEMQALFEGRAVVGLEEVRKKMAELNTEYLRLGQGKVEIEAMIKCLEQFQTPLQKAADHAKELGAYLKFADKAKDLQTMTGLVKTLGEELSSMAAAGASQGLPTDRAGLVEQLKTAQGTRKDFIDEMIQKIDQQEAAQRRLDEYQVAGQEEVIKQMERRHERELALSDPATTEQGRIKELAAEKKFLDEKLALVNGAVKKEIALENQLRAAKGTPHEAELQVKLNDQRKLGDEETKTRSRLRANAREKTKTTVNIAGTDFDKVNKDALASINAQKDTSGVSAQDTANSYSGVLQKLEAWKTAHKDLIASSDELRTKVNDATRSIQAEQIKAQQAVKADNLTKLKGDTGEAIAGEANIRNKILLTNQAIAATEKAIRMDVVGRKEGEAEVLALKKQAADLAKQEAKVEAQDRLQSINEDKAALDQEIAILEQRKAAGEDVETTLMQMRKQRLQSSLDAINLEAQSEIAASRNREAVEHTRQAKIGGLLREEFQKQLQKFNDEEKAAEEHENKLDEIKNRTGGKHSPLQSMEDAFGKGGLKSDFDLGMFDVYKDRHYRGQAPTPESVAAKMGLDTQGQQAARDSLGAAGSGNSAAAPTIYNVHIAMEAIPPDVNDMTKRLGKRFSELAAQKALRLGSGSPDMVKGNYPFIPGPDS